MKMKKTQKSVRYIKNKVSFDLFNYVLTQKSIGESTPYDQIEKVIQDAIEVIKNKCINAKITNLVLEINTQLVILQIYVERKNGFAPTKESKFGTSPTAYNVQVRFPFGLETNVVDNPVYIPPGDLNTLKFYQHPVTKNRIVDDVQRDFKPEDVICGVGVTMKCENLGNDRYRAVFSLQNKQSLSSLNVLYLKGADQSYSMGVGYSIIPRTNPPVYEYREVSKYSTHMQMAGLYPFFYSMGQKSKFLCRYHENYSGSYRVNSAQSNTYRKTEYEAFIRKVDHELLLKKEFNQWKTNITNNSSRYTFNLTVLNDVTIFTETKLPLVRLRDYQLALLNKCHEMIQRIEKSNRLENSESGIVSMGVGSGKTFFIFTFLQHLKNQIKTKKINISPAFCMAPTVAIGQVMAQTINRQGISTGSSAIVISCKKQMPADDFIAIYEDLSIIAQSEAGRVDHFIREDLQNLILKECEKTGLHPIGIINFLFNLFDKADLESRVKLFKDSIDVKRLLLLIESQKLIMEETGMLGINALYNLSAQFTALEKAIKDQALSSFSHGLLKEYNQELPQTNYNQLVCLPSSMKSNCTFEKINITKMTENQFIQLIQAKCTQKIRGHSCRELSRERSTLIRIACFNNRNAAILLANSGGLGNTHTRKDLIKQINLFRPIAYKAFDFLVNKRRKSLMDHQVLRWYLNELFSTIPDKININSWEYIDNIATRNSYLLFKLFEDNKNLIFTVNNRIKSILNTLTKLNSSNICSNKALKLSNTFSIPPETTVINVVNQLTSVINLRSIDRFSLTSNVASCFLDHIPVFTPEGFACYFEYLMELSKSKKKITFFKKFGVVSIKIETILNNNFNYVKEKLKQLCSSLIIADEVHEDSFRFLYEQNNILYKRINIVIQRILKKEFIDILPNRIGMTGTLNLIAKTAFSKIIYQLSTSNMIKRRLMKEVHVTQIPQFPNSEYSIEHYAQKIVILYFSQGIEGLTNGRYFYLSELSKGLIFTGKNNLFLKQLLSKYFNLLINTNINPDEKKTQDAILLEIKNQRKSNRKLKASSVVRRLRKAWKNHLFALYIEYIVSKSSAPKELSDIIGIQNQLFSLGFDLLKITNSNFFISCDKPVDKKIFLNIENLLLLMGSVDPNCITKQDIDKFLYSRINCQLQRAELQNIFFKHKNNYTNIPIELNNFVKDKSINKIVTDNQSIFESGSVFAMIAGEAQRTGYSHEPVGIIADVSACHKLVYKINTCLNKDFTNETLYELFIDIKKLLMTTYSYNEKNQMGGRALRTPKGHVAYIENLTNLNSYVQKNRKKMPLLSALIVETSFSDVFNADEELVKNHKATVTFNRVAITLLSNAKYSNLAVYERNVRKKFKNELSDPIQRETYEKFIGQRLLFLWSLHKKQNSLDYLNGKTTCNLSRDYNQPKTSALLFTNKNKSTNDRMRCTSDKIINPKISTKKNALDNLKKIYIKLKHGIDNKKFSSHGLFGGTLIKKQDKIYNVTNTVAFIWNEITDKNGAFNETRFNKINASKLQNKTLFFLNIFKCRSGIRAHTFLTILFGSYRSKKTKEFYRSFSSGFNHSQ